VRVLSNSTIGFILATEVMVSLRPLRLGVIEGWIFTQIGVVL